MKIVYREVIVCDQSTQFFTLSKYSTVAPPVLALLVVRVRFNSVSLIVLMVYAIVPFVPVGGGVRLFNTSSVLLRSQLPD